MLKRNCYLLLFGVSFLSCKAQKKWEPFSDEKGQFTIEFQGKPTIKTETQQFQFANVTWTTFLQEKSDDNNISYSIKYADFPAKIITSDSLRLLKDLFIITQTDLLKSIGENGLDNLNLKQIQKYPGREFRWIDKQNKIGYTRRTFLVKTRLYFLEVKYKIANDFNNDIEGFLDKFALLKTVDNQNPEITAEKPVKKFDIAYPGKTKIRDNPTFHELFGNTYAMLEAYEVPKDQLDLASSKNIMFGVNYLKIPSEKIKNIPFEKLKEFVIKAFTDNIKQQVNGKIIYQKEINLDGNWGIEGQGTMFNGAVVMHLRAYIVGDYYYQIIVMSKNGTQNNKEALDFFNSFKLKQE